MTEFPVKTRKHPREIFFPSDNGAFLELCVPSSVHGTACLYVGLSFFFFFLIPRQRLDFEGALLSPRAFGFAFCNDGQLQYITSWRSLAAAFVSFNGPAAVYSSPGPTVTQQSFSSARGRRGSRRGPSQCSLFSSLFFSLSCFSQN